MKLFLVTWVFWVFFAAPWNYYGIPMKKGWVGFWRFEDKVTCESIVKEMNYERHWTVCIEQGKDHPYPLSVVDKEAAGLVRKGSY